LSFKIILIQKSQISVFRKYLNLFEVEYGFDLNLNFGLKFKKCNRDFDGLLIFHRSPKSIVTRFLLAAQSIWFSFSLFSFMLAQVTSGLAHPSNPFSFPAASPSALQPTLPIGPLGLAACRLLPPTNAAPAASGRVATLHRAEPPSILLRHRKSKMSHHPVLSNSRNGVAPSPPLPAP
jgi:hypothetical protein